MRAIVIPAVLWATTAAAQDYAPRDTDRILDAAGMAQDVVGRTHEFFDGGVSFFSVSGTYTYTYPDGARAYGDYELRNGGADGIVCSAFSNGFSRCDMYVRDGDRLVLITESGVRFPVRAVQ